MARGSKKAVQRKKAKAKPSPSSALTSSLESQVGESMQSQAWNFDLAAGPGCHIARTDASETCSSWVLEWEAVDPEEFVDELDDIPDIALEDGVLTLCNIERFHVVAYLTIYDTLLRGRDRQVLQAGSTTNNEGQTESCTTLIVLCPPTTFVHLCYVDDPSLANHPHSLRLDSDVQEWRRHPHPADTHPRALGFPLGGPGPYRCTQGEGGQLTHFFAGNLHAIDFACPVGTPLLAVGDGTVVQVQASNRLTGIAVSNLFEWNSILIQLDPAPGDDGVVVHDDDGPLFVEYVHIATAAVQPGERVLRGQILGTSGCVGFSPEPHLHFAAYRSDEPTAATVRVFFEGIRQRINSCDSNPSPAPDDSGGGGQPKFLPKAGCWYNCYGKVRGNEA